VIVERGRKVSNILNPTKKELEKLIKKSAGELQELRRMLKRVVAGKEIGVKYSNRLRKILARDAFFEDPSTTPVARKIMHKLLGLSADRLDTLKNEKGLPISDTNAYIVPEVVQWYVNYRIKADIERYGEGEALDAIKEETAKVKLDRQKIGKAQDLIKYEREIGSLILTAEVNTRDLAKVVRVRQALERLSEDMRAKPGYTISEIADYAEERAREICDGFAGIRPDGANREKVLKDIAEFCKKFLKDYDDVRQDNQISNDNGE
jgi:hypothetical protein